MLALVLMGAAFAGPVADLAAAAPGVPIIALRCDHASRIVGGDSQFGFAVEEALDGQDAGTLFDLERPLALVMTTTAEGVTTLAIEGGVVEPERLAERIADPAFQAQLPEGAIVSPVGDRLRMVLPLSESAAPTGLPVVDRVDGDGGVGCVIAVDAPAMFGAAPPPIPLIDRVGVIVAHMEDPLGEHRIRAEIADIPPEVATILDGDGPPGFTVATSTAVFPTVLQVHGGIDQVLRALPFVSSGPVTAVAASLAEDLDERLVGAPGILVAIGGEELGGAIVVPMERPQSPGKLRKILLKMGEAVGAQVTKRKGGLLDVSFGGRPPLTAGVRKGLIVVALRDDVAADVLAGVGTPWMPAPTAPYGLRFIGGEAAYTMIGFDGYLEARYTDGALELLVQPAAR